LTLQGTCLQLLLLQRQQLVCELLQLPCYCQTPTRVGALVQNPLCLLHCRLALQHLALLEPCQALNQREGR
jgi:hypothetical protein